MMEAAKEWNVSLLSQVCWELHMYSNDQAAGNARVVTQKLFG